MLTQVDRASALAVLVAGSVVLTLGVAPVGTLATNMIVGSAPPKKAGSAAAMSETSAEFGGALGIAVLGSIGTAVYRSQMAGSVPAGVPPQAAEAARDTLGGAVAAADGLPNQLGAGLLDAAREAFTQGLQLTAITSAAIVLGMAILAAVLLRHVRPNAGTAEADEAAASPVAVDESR
jgi:MFS transporter, DHA2 family, multidrug resistance protein